MSLENASKVIRYAANHAEFRNALSNPSVLKDFSAQLNLSNQSVTNDEMAAILNFNESDYQSIGKLFDSFATDGGVDDATAKVVL
jgi:hypothetical protein